MARPAISLVLLVGLLTTSVVRANDTVAELRGAMDQPPSASPSTPAPAPAPPPARKEPSEPDGWNWDDRPSDEGLHEEDNDSDLALWGLGAALGGMAITAPVWAPRSLVNDGETQNGWFTRYPYQHHDSYMTFERPLEGDNEPWEPSNWSLRIESDFGTNFDDQQLLGGHVLWEHVNRLGIESRFNFLEDNFVTRADDSLYFGDVNGTYRFAHSHHWLFRGGLGMNWLADHGDEDFGFNATYQIDWFPTDPLVFSTDLDVGTLGDAWLFHFQQTAGVTWRGLEARVGYDYLDVGDAQFSLFLCGVRGWF